jgi:hypothetical protein
MVDELHGTVHLQIMSSLAGGKGMSLTVYRPWSDAVLVQLYLALPVIAPLLQNFSVISKKAVTYSGPSKVKTLYNVQYVKQE